MPASVQAQAWREICRVLKPQGGAVIAHHWGRHATLMNRLTWPVKLMAFPGRAAFLKGCIHSRWGEKYLLAALNRLQEEYPHFLRRVGHYPLFIIQKR